MSFGKKLKDLRLASNLSQAEFARRIGVKQSAITAYEKNFKLPSSGNLIKTAEVFNVSVDYLLGLSPEKKRNLGLLLRIMLYFDLLLTVNPSVMKS